MNFEEQATPPAHSFEVIEPPKGLQHLVVKGGSPGIDFNAIARAEKALASLSEHFEGWMGDEIAALTEAGKQARAAGFSPEFLSALFHAAHDIKGQAMTLGHARAGEVAASLCRLIEEMPNPQRIPALLVDQHIDAIAAIVREHDTAHHKKLAAKLVRKLGLVTDDFLAREKERAAAEAGDPTEEATDAAAEASAESA